jgi:cytochrome d ubiquinol oxidase subunit I
MDVALSLSLYILVYLIMFPTGIAFMAAIVHRGVAGATEPPPAIEAGRPMPAYVAPAPAPTGE